MSSRLSENKPETIPFSVSIVNNTFIIIVILVVAVVIVDIIMINSDSVTVSLSPSVVRCQHSIETIEQQSMTFIVIVTITSHH